MKNNNHSSRNRPKRRRIDATGCFFTLVLAGLILFLTAILLNWVDLTQILPEPTVPNIRVFPPQIGEFTAIDGEDDVTGNIILSGQGEPNALITLMQGEQLFASGIVEETSTWQIEKEVTLPSGRVDLIAQMFDAEGELQGRSNSFSFRIPEASAVAMIESGPTPEATEMITETAEPTATMEATAVPATPTPLPPTATPIPSTESVLVNAGNFTMWLTMLENAGKTNLLAQDKVTMFTPTDDLFASLPPEMVDGLLSDSDFVDRYTVSEPFALENGTVVTTNAGITLTLTISQTTIKLNDAELNDPITTPNATIFPTNAFLFSANTPPPIIDSSGVATFSGNFLTVVGTAQPNQTILLASNNTIFGTATTTNEGNWQIGNSISTGTHILIAYVVNQQNIPLNASTSVELIVTDSE